MVHSPPGRTDPLWAYGLLPDTRPPQEDNLTLRAGTRCLRPFRESSRTDGVHSQVDDEKLP
jgi:hypothetical protein